MSPIKNVAILGASGTLGQLVVSSLLRAGFNVTAITRPDSTNKFSTEGVTIKSAQYSDVEALTTALRGQDAIIEAFNPSAAVNQSAIVTAALAAGVSHLITPDFSSDTFNENVDELLIFAPKRAAQRELEDRVAQSGGKLSWTAIIVGGWYDWGIERGAFWVNKENRTIMRFGSGDQKYNISRVGFAADCVAEVLRDPERYHNRTAYFSSHVVTTNQLVPMIQEIGGTEWKVVDVAIDGFVDQAKKLWEADTEKGITNRMTTSAYAMLGTAAIFDEENRYGGYFGDKAESGWDEGEDALKANLRRLLE